MEARVRLARRRIAAELVRVGEAMGAPRIAIKAALEAGIVESNLTNIKRGPGRSGDRDSAGVLQQRPSQGWGTYKQVTNVRYAARQFYKRAIPIAGKYKRAGDLAQAVQRSAYPGRYHEVRHEAGRLLRSLRGSSTSAGSPGFSDKTLTRRRYTPEREQTDIEGALIDALKNPKAAKRPLTEAARLIDTGAYTRTIPAKVERKRVSIPGGARGRDAVPQGRMSKGLLAHIVNEARSRGLTVSEYEPFDKVDPVHTEGSFHYRKRRGRSRAADISGDAKALKEFNRWVARNYGSRVSELFHDPGVNIDNGKRTKPIGGHGKHVHVAV